MSNTDTTSVNPYETPGSSGTANDLGEMLFEKRPHKIVMTAPAITAVVCLFVGFGCLVMSQSGASLDDMRSFELLAYGLTGCALAVALSLLAVVQWKSVLRLPCQCRLTHLSFATTHCLPLTNKQPTVQ